MKTVKVINIDKKYPSGSFELPDSFVVGGYSFTRKDDDVYGVLGEYHPSVISLGGSFGDPRNPKSFELLDDILIIGSLLTGRNWFRQELNTIEYRQRLLNDVNNFRSLFFKNSDRLFLTINSCLNEMSDLKWRKKYENGYHLKMLLNHSKIFHDEARFLSMMVIWEWLYPHMHEREEADSLILIMRENLEKAFGPHQVPDKNIFYVLRNQLAHSGRLPIDRKYAADWMKELPFSNDNLSEPSVLEYLNFFDELTRIVVFKTLDIHLDRDPILEGIKIWNTNDRLKSFLMNGKI